MGRLNRISRSESGNAMIEFALLAPVFFMLIVGLIEFVLYQYKAYALNHVVYEAARNLQTGEIQNSADMEAALREEVCIQGGSMIDCESIYFDVRSFQRLRDISYPPAQFNESGEPSNFTFNPGGPGEYTVVRAAIRHGFVTPFMDKMFGTGPDHPAIVNSFCVVKNEPWL